MTSAKPESLCSEDIRKGVEVLRMLVQSCYGPNGKLKMLQNACGGHVTITSTSSRLLKTMVIANPINKVITTAAQSHLKCYGNDGLYLMLVVMELLKRSQNLEISKPVLSSVTQNLTQAIITHLQDCSLRVTVDFSNITLPMLLLHSILKTKPACGLSEKHQGHLARLLMKGFLNSIPQPDDSSSKMGNVYFTTHSGMSPSHCDLFSGIFIETYDSKLISIPGDHRKCALFRVSLSGDFETDLSDDNWTLHCDINTVEACVAQILVMCEKLVVADVSVVACQKVIHPRVKKYLYDHGLLVIDRLGLLSFDALLNYTGATPFESFLGTLDQRCFGTVDKISIFSANKKNFYHFQNLDSLVSTMFLYNYQEESVEELLATCQQAVGALRGLLSVPHVFCGGGCLETHLAAYIRHWGAKNQLQLIATGATPGKIQLITEAFAKSLESIAISVVKQSDEALTDECYHLWIHKDSNFLHCDTLNDSVLTCKCGLMMETDYDEVATHLTRLAITSAKPVAWKENSVSGSKLNSMKVIDAALSKEAAIKSAFETFLVLLKVDAVIKTEHNSTSSNIN